nr:hypothetical protein [Tanacetum cinerariifolium]
MYVVRRTRPDVAFAQNVTSQFQKNPGDIHWATVKNILKVSCYTDAVYLTNADDLKSQTRYVFVLNGGAVDWKSAKQSIFATSSVEAEYIATFDAFKEAVWVRKFISGLGVVPTIKEPISMYCYNTGEIAIANESRITKGARHFHAKVHYLRDVIEFVFQKEVENQLSKTIKSLCSDRTGEYMSQEFLDHLKDHRIISHRTPPYTPQYNGVSKRRNRTLLDMVEKTPYKVWHGKAPKLSYLKVWGCEVLVKRDTLTKPNKLEPKSIKCIFIGYLKETMGYSFYYPPENKVLVARNAEFLENSLIDQEASGEMDEPQSDIVPIRRSTRTRHAPDRMCLYIGAEEHELGNLGEPASYKAALLDPESEKWLNAINVEMLSMKDNEVWFLVKLPPNGKTVGNIRAIRILIAIATYYDYEIWQTDVKTVFLNGYLNKEVYMEQPEGFVNPKYPSRVCKLQRSIYRLKQASRQWNKRFDDEIKKFGFTQNLDEPCVYLKASGSNITFLILYVDDILIMGNNVLMLQSVKPYLGKCFAKKDLEKILKRYCMENSKRGSIPMQEKLKLSKSQERNKLISKESRVSCYTNAVYLTNADDLKSQTRYVFVLNGGVVDWKSAKQSIFATSSVKAEYIATFDASKEAVWVRKFISGLGVVPTIKEPISMYCDNTGEIAIANESGITKGARHFYAKVHYLRDVIEFGNIKLEKVHTYDNLADPFTKALAFPKHFEHTRNIGMLPASSLI